MARPKNKTPRYSAIDFDRKRLIAEFGPHHDFDALRRAAVWIWEADRPTHSPQQAKELLRQASEAYAQGDKGFFQELAVLSARRHDPVEDKLRYSLLHSFFRLDGVRKKHPPTMAELCSQVKESLHLVVTPRHLRRVCKELGIKLEPGKSGLRPNSRSLPHKEK
jgi:hypothetical protein